MAVLLLMVAAYAAYRMTQRAAVPVEDTGVMAPVYPASTAMAVEIAQEVAIEADLEGQEEENAA
jgi:hypothetical protein